MVILIIILTIIKPQGHPFQATLTFDSYNAIGYYSNFSLSFGRTFTIASNGVKNQSFILIIVPYT